MLSYAAKSKAIDMKELPFFDRYSAENYKPTNNSTIDPSTSLRDLGITVSNDFSWSSHILNIASKGNQMASWVLSLFKNRGKVLETTVLIIQKYEISEFFFTFDQFPKKSSLSTTKVFKK